MTTTKRHKSRGFHYNSFNFNYVYGHIQPFLGKTLLSMLPAFLYGCASVTENICPFEDYPATKVTITGHPAEVSSLDIFVFNDDAMQKLDCYQRIDDMAVWKGLVVSSSGKRMVTALANFPHDRGYWYNLDSRSYLRKMHAFLDQEAEETPLMIGEASLDTSCDPSIENLGLTPLAGRIILNSICCDFGGKAYSGEKLTDVKIYLTNVNAECAILEEGTSLPKRIINSGKLMEDDLESFREPGLIMQKIPESIGTEVIYPDISLMCYQSNHQDETPGTPYTRLVIEGRISGQTYYWPININRDGSEEPGIWRGRCYSYDVKITRKGTSDPDIPVRITDIIINQEVKEWKEKEEYEVAF